MNLTDEDRAAIERINARRGKPPASIGGIREECYLAGLRAGMERLRPWLNELPDCIRMAELGDFGPLRRLAAAIREAAT